MSDTASFYDELAEYYPLIYSDWDASIRNQAQALDSVISQHSEVRPQRILDAACGIGTQAIGLAQLGYEMSASDVSGRAIAEAAQHAADRELSIDFQLADMRGVDEVFPNRFGVVIACDNSIPHLLSDEAILEAFRSFFIALEPGGLAMVSVRDYGSMELGGSQVHPRLVHDRGGLRHILCDVWDFDGDQYSITIYVITDDGSGLPEVKAIRGGRYYCVSIETLRSLFQVAGFSQVAVLHDAYFQPMLVAKKPAGA